ncbi:hypothetical protein TWF594_009567 [Orbilia oligospora]|nr:hypothetical protein TWF594_009567 [Orbilia oligospora]
MERRRALYDYLASIHRLDPKIRRTLRLQNNFTNWRLAATRARVGSKLLQPIKRTTTLRECAHDQGIAYSNTDAPLDADENVGVHDEDEPASSIVSGLLSLPLELHFMLLEHYFDARDHSALAGVCKLWNHIMKTSRTARAKRYVSYHDDDKAASSSPSARPKIDLPRNFKVHIALLIGHSQQYFFKDSTSVQDKGPSTSEDAYRFGLKGRYPGLNTFAEDPLFVFPDHDQNSDKELKAKAKSKNDQTQELSNDQGKTAAENTSGEDASSDHDLPEESRISFKQSYIYKYQTIGMFPSLLGAGIHGAANRIALTKSSKVSDYTKALIAEMKELAKKAREKRCSELTRSTSDKQIISLWERLTATDGEFLVQVNNFCMIYDEHRLDLKMDANQLYDFSSDPSNNDLFFDKAIALLDLNVLPPSRLSTRHPFSDSEDDE